jgi:voltage-gated potassium channel
MATEASPRPEQSHAYDLFILVLTVFSLALMVLLILPISGQTRELVTFYDNIICLIFLFDFFLNLFTAPSKREYLIGRRGWLDLLGSVPSFGFFTYTGLLRLARISRLARITRILRGDRRKEILGDILHNRAQYAAFVTVLLAGMVLVVASILVLQFESRSPDANITTGGDALWWAVVTITTVGYGDRYPVTALGRFTAVLVMFSGVGIIGALASILASILVPPPEENGETAIDGAALQQELAQVRAELVALRELIANGRSDAPG